MRPWKYHPFLQHPLWKGLYAFFFALAILDITAFVLHSARYPGGTPEVLHSVVVLVVILSYVTICVEQDAFQKYRITLMVFGVKMWRWKADSVHFETQNGYCIARFCSQNKTSFLSIMLDSESQFIGFPELDSTVGKQL